MTNVVYTPANTSSKDARTCAPSAFSAQNSSRFAFIGTGIAAAVSVFLFVALRLSLSISITMLMPAILGLLAIIIMYALIILPVGQTAKRKQ